MKLKNITNSDKELTNSITGERILIKPNQVIEIKKAVYNPNAFKIIDEIPKIKLNRKNRPKTIRRLKTNDTSK